MGQVHEVVLDGVSKPDRRRYPRYKCSVPVEIRLPGANFPSQGQTTDLSLSGCYVSTRFNLSVGVHVELKLWLGELGIGTKAAVRTSDPGVGNGIEFLSLDETSKQALSDYLAKLDETHSSTSAPSIRDLLIV